MRAKVEIITHNHTDNIQKPIGYCIACDNIRKFWDDDGWEIINKHK